MKTLRILLINLAAIALTAAALVLYTNSNADSYRQASVAAIEQNARGMQEVAYTYMLGEQNVCDSWAAYINASGMTMEEAAAFVRASLTNQKISAHLVWADTYEGLSTAAMAGTSDRYEVIYQNNVNTNDSGYTYSSLNALTGLELGGDQVHITFSYTNPMDGTRVIAFASEVTLLDEGAQRQALLLRVVPMSYLRSSWSFVSDYKDASVALMEPNGAFIIQPSVMKNNNFYEFINSYNAGSIDTDALQQTLRTSAGGSFFASNARGERMLFAYAGIDSADGWIVVVAIPESSVFTQQADTGMAWYIMLALAVLLMFNMFYFTQVSRRDHETHRLMQEQVDTITRQREELETALKAAQQSSNAKTVFLNNMSHDMRTPMNAIIGFTGLAAKHAGDPEQVREDLKKIELSGNQLLALINDVLDMSRIESGSVTLQESSERVTDLVQAFRTIIQPTIDEKQLKLEVDTAGVTHGGIICDRLRLSQIMLNLLSNAMKFTPAGGTVSVSVDEEPGAPDGYVDCVIKVKDTGIGISPDFLPHVFESFTREKSSTVSGIQGTGLGMAITRNLVTLMGGTIGVDSTLGKGTQFTVKLRFKTCEAPVNNEQPAQTESGQGFDGRKLLLVEDNELNREIAAEILEDAGFTVDTACDGDEAVEKLRGAVPGQYDLILMDIQMPRMDGYEATRQIRALPTPGVRDVPIIAMTANAFAEDRQKAFDAGMNGHVAKPIDVKTLFETIRKVIR